MPKIRLVPYKMGSGGCSALKQATNILRLNAGKALNLRLRPADILINWGTATFHTSWAHLPPVKWVNHPHAVATAINKLQFFNHVPTFWSADHVLQVVDHTTDMEDVIGWINEGHRVVLRFSLVGRGGDGIVIVSTLDELREATSRGNPPLATKYVKKRDEYRVHVAGGEVIHVQQKRKRSGQEPADWSIRSYRNGWVFCQEGVEIPDQIKAECVDFVRQFGLDFGALDIVHNNHHNMWRIVELNTAPGLEGTTLEKYKDALLAIVEVKKHAIQSTDIQPS